MATELRKLYITDPTTGDQASVNSDGQLHVVAEGKVSTDNSSSTPLGIDGVFTGTSVETLAFAVIVVSVYSDVASATDGLEIQQSADGTNWDHTDCFTIPAATGKTFSFQPQAQYLRVVYTNGGTEQATFRLQTTLKKTYVKPSSHRIQDSIVDEDDAELVKAVITGKNPGGSFVNFQSTAAGNFKISIEEFDEAVSIPLAAFTDNLDGETAMHTAAAMFGRVDDDTLAPIKIDGSTQDIQIVEHEHAEIHGGDHYNYCDYALNQASAATIEFVLTTPNTTKWPHLTFNVSSSEGATIELYEGTSGVTGGTSITPRNNNRNSANTAAVTIVKDPTSITSDGTRASGYLAGGGRTAGFAERSREFVLKQNETYLVRITSLAVSNDISWCADWYEHTDKN